MIRITCPHPYTPTPKYPGIQDSFIDVDFLTYIIIFYD